MPIPTELKQLKNWSVSLNLEELKRPRHTHYKPNGAFAYQTAVNNSKDRLMGFYVTQDDPYILGDLDHLDDPNNPWEGLPIAVASFIQEHPTYAEISPSGKGVRFIYKLPSAALKKTLSGKTFYGKGAKKGHKRDTQVSFGPPWCTITENETEYSQPYVAEVTLEELEDVFDIRYMGDKDDALADQAAEQDGTDLPDLGSVRTFLMVLPMDQNPRILRAYEKIFGHAYAHYDYWIKVMMALHDYASRSGFMIECLSLFDAWSSLDVDAYKGVEDVTAHWRSMSDKTDKISYKTLFALGHACTLKWPVPRKQSKAEKEAGLARKPLITEYSNFLTLVDYYDIKMWREETDQTVAYVTGDQDIIDKYFKVHKAHPIYGRYYGPFEPHTLKAAFHVLCQEHLFTSISHTQVQIFVINYFAYTLRTFHRIRKFFNTPFLELPLEYQENADTYDTSTTEAIYNTLDVVPVTPSPKQELALYRKYVHVWMMSFVRGLYYTDSVHKSPCILLLTGPEGVRKTSFFRMMFPSFMRKFNVISPHGFANLADIRDNSKLAATNNVIIFDEFERYLLPDTEAGLKKVVEGDPQTFIDKYDKTPTQVTPRAIYGATSNQSTFNLSNEGSRRLFHVPVKWVDTDALLKINWHSVVNAVRKEVDEAFKSSHVPWLFSEQELTYQRSLHGNLRSKTNLDILLLELFDWDYSLSDDPYKKIIKNGKMPDITGFQTDRTGRFLTTRQVNDAIINSGIAGLPPKRVVLTKTLRRLCGEFTGSSRVQVYIQQPKGFIDKGEFCQGSRRKWVMPPPYDKQILRTVFKK